MLVTGGWGMLGRAAVDALRSAGPRVRMLDVREPALRDGLVELVTGGVTDPKTTREAVDGSPPFATWAAQLPQAPLEDPR